MSGSKPESCASCGAALDHSATGRPRTYCGAGCRRLAERKIAVAQRLLIRARTKEQDMRARIVQVGKSNVHQEQRDVAAFWAAEAASHEAELAALLSLELADAGDRKGAPGT